ncbi:MAG: leucine--tRNA ligase [Rickettsiales bacterium]|jgi:leucyl-tRNA synthetase|nr:leucine--tRNA ligase [Rickettsiales bacterium]
MISFKEYEKKWQDKWFGSDVFTAGLPANAKKEKKYILVEFPFPSADGLHMGHMFAFGGQDIIARFWRMKGKDVLFPIGFDAQGIAAETYAVKKKIHPGEAVKIASDNYTRQMKSVGLSFDYKKSVSTADPEYVRWTQWQFIQMWKAGLLYKAPLPINWCDNCRTNFTNEELEDGNCPRCKGPIEKKMKEQWNFAITKYADRLVDDLALVDFPENVKEAQRNWVGRSHGAEVDFGIFKVYTTRIDTIYGVSFCCVAPEHELLKEWLDAGKIENADEVRAYIKETCAKTTIERTDITKEKTGVLLKGIFATNPYTNEKVPVFAADYVLANYATGTIMAVPAGDERDREFAEKYKLPIPPIKEVSVEEALENPAARAATKYKMTDWGFSRQMYWGEPIPLVYCKEHGWQPVPDSQLPVLQPYMDDFRPTPQGESPLARAKDWVKTTCPVCGGDATRETDTMPQWAGSCWFYLRYMDHDNTRAFASPENIRRWMPVDHYNGGFEHVTRHMIYARFWYKALFDLGLVPAPEPFAKRTINGLVMGPDGTKMSKSRGNVISPDDLIEEIGADAARLFIFFLGPWDANIIPNPEVKTGVKRFLQKVEGLLSRVKDVPADERARNAFIKDITERVPEMRFNTSIARMMEYANELSKMTEVPKKNFEALIKALSLFAPHFAEEVWEQLGNKTWLASESWDEFDPTLAASAEIVVVVSVNGKRRAEILVQKDEPDIEKLARAAASKFITGEPRRVVVVPDKMVNFVL